MGHGETEKDFTSSSHSSLTQFDKVNNITINWTRRLQIRALLQKIADHGILKALNDHKYMKSRSWSANT